MKAKITYCVMWNYLPDAERASAELKSKGVSVELIKGSNGVFDVGSMASWFTQNVILDAFQIVENF